MTTFTDEIRETVSPHKFGGDRMAAALWLLSLHGGADEETGDACDWHFWCARLGRWLLYCGCSGFVSSERFATEDAAKIAFAEIDAEYSASDEDEG